MYSKRIGVFSNSFSLNTAGIVSFFFSPFLGVFFSPLQQSHIFQIRWTLKSLVSNVTGWWKHRHSSISSQFLWEFIGHVVSRRIIVNYFACSLSNIWRVRWHKTISQYGEATSFSCFVLFFFSLSATQEPDRSSVASPVFNTSAHLLAISLVSTAWPPAAPPANQLLCCLVILTWGFPLRSSHLKVNPLIRSTCMSLGLDWSQLQISTLSLSNAALYTAVPTLTVI